MGRRYNIGIDIDVICGEYEIENYTIRSDGKVNVDGDVSLSHRYMSMLPLEFGEVSGDFNCRLCHLKTLKGAPEIVGGDFDIAHNYLTTLEGAPEKVGGYFNAYNNRLTSLKGAPEYVGSNFNCNYNKLTSLDYCPKYVYGTIKFNNNDVYDISFLSKCRYNNLQISKNNISTIIEDIVDLEHFYLINPLRGNKLSKMLYDEVREDLNLPKFDYRTLNKNIELID